MTIKDTDRLTKLMALRLECLSGIRDLSIKQRELIEVGEIGQLLRLLSAKQRLLLRMGDADQQLKPFLTQDPEQRPWRNKEDRGRCAKMADLCDLLLKQVMEQERQCEELLSKRRDGVARQLHELGVRKSTHDAYSRQDSESLNMLDLSTD